MVFQRRMRTIKKQATLFITTGDPYRCESNIYMLKYLVQLADTHKEEIVANITSAASSSSSSAAATTFSLTDALAASDQLLIEASEDAEPAPVSLPPAKKRKRSKAAVAKEDDE